MNDSISKGRFEEFDGALWDQLFERYNPPVLPSKLALSLGFSPPPPLFYVSSLSNFTSPLQSMAAMN